MSRDNEIDLSVHRGFRVGGWLVQSSLNRLTRGDEVVQLEPKTMDLLVFLARHAGKVVSQDTIIDEVWKVEAVSVGTLTHAIAELRKAFGDDAKNPSYIETIPKRGYRLLVKPEPGWDEAGESTDEQESKSAAAPWVPQIGDTMSHYRIVDKLGEGGMGEVYRAHDTVLRRDVAVKVLGAQLAESPDRISRFEREARAVATLSHPNVLEVYELGRHGGRPFMVTELLKGETLRETLEDGALGWRRATEIVAAIADGIAAAHEAGIVHRDLKPSNVFLTADGRVKILDFGLARVGTPVAEGAADGAPSFTLTQHGAVVGTVGYMSPEQIRGEPADHRSDIFALGCVLYEAVSGRRAFERETPPETMTAILREEPEDISASGVAIPHDLADAVGRCLEKRPKERFQSACDLADSLRSISSASAPLVARPAAPVRRSRRAVAGIAVAAAIVAVVVGILLRGGPSEKATVAPPELFPNRVAVVPLENRTGDPSLDTLGVMAADLIVQRINETGAAEVVPLAEALAAVPSASIRGEQRRGWDHTLRLARERGAGLLLSGAYYLDAGTLWLQARLTDGATAELIYAFEPVEVSREAAAEGVDTLRERVAAAVAAHLHPDIDISVQRPPSSYAAFQAALRGDELWEVWGEESNWPEVIEHYRRALEIDPDYHGVLIAGIHANEVAGDLEGARLWLSSAEESLERMTPYEQALVQVLRCRLELDWGGALKASRRVVDLAPRLTDPCLRLGIYAQFVNRPREAVEAYEPIVFSFAPTKPKAAWWAMGLITSALHMLGEHERELQYRNLGFERFPDGGHCSGEKAIPLAAMGRIEEANQAIDDSLRIQTSLGVGPGCLMTGTACEFGAHGYREASRAMAARALEWFEVHRSELAARPRDHLRLPIALMLTGRPEEARDVLLELAEVTRYVYPDTLSSPTAVHGSLGVVAARLGDREEALRIFDAISPGDDPWSVVWRFYWRAAIAAHLGQKDWAVQLLTDAFSAGLPYAVDWHSAFEFEPLWGYPPFQKLLEPQG